MILWISVFNYPCFYGCAFRYPWISMDIHALTCYGSSIQGFQTSNDGLGRDRQNSQNHVDRSLEDLAILFLAFWRMSPRFKATEV